MEKEPVYEVLIGTKVKRWTYRKLCRAFEYNARTGWRTEQQTKVEPYDRWDFRHPKTQALKVYFLRRLP